MNICWRSLRKKTAVTVKVLCLLSLALIMISIQSRATQTMGSQTARDEDVHLILWYNPSTYLVNRPEALRQTFDACSVSKCRLTFDRNEAYRSKAVIFDGRKIHTTYQSFPRPRDQLWVWWSNEAPPKYREAGSGWSAVPYVNGFNLTMTYHRKSDVYIPYGQIVPKLPPEPKNFTEIIAKKKKGVLWIASNCHTSSWREQYVAELRKYLDVDVLGECSDNFQPWNCGKRYQHDECFNILNDYKFFLAFENALCEDYVTEKFYENFDFDTILVERGGLTSNLKELLPPNTYIDASEFKGPRELGKYLRNLMNDTERYRRLLESKNQWRNMPYYRLYQQALCDLCDRVTYPEQFHIGAYRNIREYFHESNFCRLPADVPSRLKRKH